MITDHYCERCGHHRDDHIISEMRCVSACTCPGYYSDGLTEDQKNQLRGHGLLDDGIPYVSISDPTTERIVARMVQNEKDEIARVEKEKSKRCEKCGGDDLLIRWHGEGSYHPSRKWQSCWGDYGDTHGEPKEEHLHYHCRTCQYDWTGPLTPPEGNQ